MFQPRGIIPAMVTPFNHDESLNEQALRDLTRHLLAGCVHGLFVVGSQGEFWALEYEEKKRIIEIVVAEAGGKVPVYAGTGATSTREAVRTTRMAAAAGADAVSVITPYFISPSADELYEYYVAVAKASSAPVLLYNNPARTGVNMSPDLVARLSRVDNIVGIKDSSGDMTQTGEYIRRCDSQFAVLAGRDTMILSTLVYGGKGAIAATANVAPRLIVEIYDAFLAGDMQRALDAQYRLAPLRIAFEMGSFPVVIKDALELMGIAAGPARGPVAGISAEKKARLAEIVKAVQ
ncbi:MAG: 4-hydroxy-tetrahydrodipicolinate synthase [Chloroflexota bacterium]|nr:4-hydroxy-tetrahydrodipicolinate synthase [Chloroflexota bacterium]